MLSKSQQELPLDPQTKTAIIFHIVELGHYIVEIRFQNESVYIKDHNENKQFANLSLAKEAAIKAGATLMYQALDNIHGDVGIDAPRFDYAKI